VIICAAACHAPYRYDHSESAVAVTWTGTSGAETLALVVHGLMGQGGGSIPARLVTQMMQRQLGATPTEWHRDPIYSPSQMQLAACTPGALDGRPESRLRAALALTQQALAAAHPQHAMGAAVVVALFAGGEVAFAQVGHCRAYRLRPFHQPFQLTQHHELELQQTIVLATALGLSTDPAIDFHSPALVPGDLFILASPELLRHLPSTDLASLASQGPDPTRLGHELTARASARRATCDHSVAVVRVTAEAEARPA
jgi:serine/threonine protein phosphatase PrpC